MFFFVKKILHLENQIQRYLLQINNLEDRLAVRKPKKFRRLKTKKTKMFFFCFSSRKKAKAKLCASIFNKSDSVLRQDLSAEININN